MNRPERIELPLQKEFDGEIIKKPIECEGYMRGYNMACSDWEAYLPTEQEIGDIVLEWLIYNSDRLKLAKTIHERISK